MKNSLSSFQMIYEFTTSHSWSIQIDISNDC